MGAKSKVLAYPGIANEAHVEPKGPLEKHLWMSKWGQEASSKGPVPLVPFAVRAHGWHRLRLGAPGRLRSPKVVSKWYPVGDDIVNETSYTCVCPDGLSLLCLMWDFIIEPYFPYLALDYSRAVPENHVPSAVPWSLTNIAQKF